MVPGSFRKQRVPAKSSRARAPGPLRRLQAAHAKLQARFDLIRLATSDGLWDMEVSGPDVAAPGNPFWWSDQFRRLLGFEGEDEFPNVLGSWSTRLHPDDRGPTLDSFRAHIEDRTGATPYDVTYRLLCKNGEYRWFRALGHTERGPDGAPLRCAGALTDLTDRNALLSLQRHAETIITSLPVGLVVLDSALRVRQLNPAFRQIAQLAGGECLDQLVERTLLVPALRDRAATLLQGGVTRQGVEMHFGDRLVRVAVTGIEIGEGERGLLALVEDVTEEQRLRDEARGHAARERELSTLLDEARDAIIVRNVDGVVQYWNKGAERLYGWAAEEVLGRHALPFLYAPGHEPREAIAHVLEHGEWTGELCQQRRDGTPIAVEGHWTLVPDEGGHAKAVVTINTDITERKASDDKIRRLALYDILTGLPNRTLLADRFGQALARARREGAELAVLFMDLNRFKEINDTQGHVVGDEVLVKVAQRLQAVLREDETLARLAGDEFVVVAGGAAGAAGELVAERLSGALQQPIAAGGNAFPVNLSIGIATYPADGQSLDDLLRRADIAMYRAKASGGGHMFYRPEMSDGLAERLELARDLAAALAEGRLQLYYQPQVEISTGALIGAEVLLRWHDPQRGWVSPAVFVQIAEERGLIGALGNWVLRSASAQLGAWLQAGLAFPGRLAMNLTVQQLADPKLAQSVRGALEEAGITPARIGLELTESGLMTNVEDAIAVMGELKRAGLSFSIDDFGTGYSSLAYLKSLPVDTLKIDISFVRDMLVDPRNHTIVTTIIGMARNLGLAVIAEGVEHQAQADALSALGCGQAQGYLFGRPLPAEEFAARWLAPAS